jgi:hypothetical protein
MTAQGFTVRHARDAQFERGLRSFFEYRDLGIENATKGRVVAHVIRATPGESFSGQAHLHRTTFQFVYVLSSVYQPPAIRHRELAHSDDLEMLEIVMPANFSTEEVASVLHDSARVSTSR